MACGSFRNTFLLPKTNLAKNRKLDFNTSPAISYMHCCSNAF